MRVLWIRNALLAASVGVVSTVQAATGVIQTQVLQTLVDSEHFGGCMAFLAAPPVGTGLNCAGQWVTFSCTGDFNSKDIAYKKFETAQLAYALGHRIIVTVDDTKKHNGYCFARRVDLSLPAQP